MEERFRRRGKGLLSYLLTIKKTMDNQTKNLVIREEDIMVIPNDFDYNRVQKIIGELIGSLEDGMEMVLIRGIITSLKEPYKQYCLFSRKVDEVPNSYNVSLNFEEMPKEFCKSGVLLRIKKYFEDNKIYNIEDKIFEEILKTIKEETELLGDFMFEDKRGILKKNINEKGIYRELALAKKVFQSEAKIPSPFRIMLREDEKNATQKNIIDKKNEYSEIACDIEEKEPPLCMVIEGPAGTGKTQNVVDFAMRMIAEGKRVLITSQRENTLKVIEERLPKEIRPIAFSVYDKQYEKYIKRKLSIINSRLSFDFKKLEKAVEVIDGKKIYKKANNFDEKKLIYFIEKSLELLETVDNSDIEKIYRSKEVLISFPKKEKIEEAIIEYAELKEIIKEHTEILKNWCVPSKYKWNEKVLFETLSEIKSKLIEFKGTYVEELLLKLRENQNFREELWEFYFVMKERLYNFRASSGGNFDGLLNLFNKNSEKFGYIPLENINISKIEAVLNGIWLSLDWEKSFEGRVFEALGNVAYHKKIFIRDLISVEEIFKVANSLKTLNRYFNLKNYIEGIKMSLVLEIDFRDLYKAISNNDIDGFSKGYAEIDRLREKLPMAIELKSYLNKLYDILQIPIDKILKENSYPDFKWGKIKTILQKSLDDLTKKDIEEINNDTIIVKSWYNFIKNISGDYNKIIESWLESYKRVNKMTKENQELINECQIKFDKCSAIIPLWMMTVNRAIETIGINENPFDVVIIEDGGQCDLTSITLLLRGKGCIITGDSEQPSPQMPGIDKKIIEEGIAVYLNDFNNKESFNYYNNLLKVAKDSGFENVKLTKQYRSDKSINSLLKDLFYGDKLTEMKSFDTMLEPIKSVYVSSGEKNEKKQINLNEAELISDTIVSCCKNPIYKGKTMAVISLLGNEQGEVIEKILKEKLSREEIIDRKLCFGDSFSLQGEERDVVFLSMVVAKNFKFVAQTKDSDSKRYNLALSRAKQQLWLFHSVELEELSSECIRYKVLKSFKEKEIKIEKRVIA